MKRLLVFLAVAWAVQAHALTDSEARAIAVGESDARIEALNKAVASADARTVAFLQALADDAVKTAGGKVIVVRDGKGTDPVTGAAVPVPDDAEDVVSNNRMRGEIDGALAALQLFSPDARQRADAVRALQREPDESKLPMLEKALAAEKDPGIREQLGLVRAAALLGSTDAAKRLAAARLLATSRSPATQTLLIERLRDEADPQVKASLQASLRDVQAALAWGDRLGAVFSGISLGSILLLVALGLAITYGLMGVINMAHGELMMVGAYATYVVQNLFRQWAPGFFDGYLVAAVPVSFLTAALVGAVLERGVIRFLYGRPLETLLATWGISLVLMQLVRTLFGAQNVGVENPR
ncbi:MAG: ABC transporter permease subunit, partial [Ramlibacter sp.]